MEKILTVVIPAYNAQDFLHKNLASFCCTEILKDIDILIVDDGSTDNTRSIAEQYVCQYPDSFRLISKENGGHGSGINTGIKYAKGQYFKVVDADDWLDTDAFVKLVQMLKTCQADIVYSGFLWAIETKSNAKRSFKTKAEFQKPFKGVNYKKTYLFDDVADLLYMKMHNMTIRTDILRENHIQIDEHCYYVDMEFITYPIPYVKTISFMNDTVYYYRIGRSGQSVSLEKMQNNEANYDKVLRSLLNYYVRVGSEIDCSLPKKRYIASLIARAVASKTKIMLSFPSKYDKRQKLEYFDTALLRKFPDIYEANRNFGVSLLRKTHYVLFPAASFFVKIIYS